MTQRLVRRPILFDIVLFEADIHINCIQGPPLLHSSVSTTKKLPGTVRKVMAGDPTTPSSIRTAKQIFAMAGNPEDTIVFPQCFSRSLGALKHLCMHCQWCMYHRGELPSIITFTIPTYPVITPLLVGPHSLPSL